MISETEFVELGNSLSTGFFADNVVLAVARTQRLGKLQDKDILIFREAIQLLNRILQGEKWLDSRKIDTRSADSALAFNRAVHALPNIRMPNEFVEYIMLLKQIISELLDKSVDPEGNLKKVRGFFYSYARAISAESQGILGRTSESPGVSSWTRLGLETT